VHRSETVSLLRSVGLLAAIGRKGGIPSPSLNPGSAVTGVAEQYGGVRPLVRNVVPLQLRRNSANAVVPFHISWVLNEYKQNLGRIIRNYCRLAISRTCPKRIGINEHQRRGTMKSITFPNGPIKIAANLHLPKDFSTDGSYVAIVVVHPAGGVKEQTAGLYSSKLADEGMMLLAS
jgi:hypothetical protein